MWSSQIHHPITQRLALIAGIAVFVVAVFDISFVSMWGLWQTSDHHYGLLVFPISAFLIWRLRYKLARIPLEIDVRGLLFVLPLAIVWVAARLTGIQTAEHIAVLAIIPALLATLGGVKITRSVLFPLLFLILATPFGDALVPRLMLITADISTGLLQASGFPLLRNGQYISLPGGDFVIADVCSGLRYLLTGELIALLYAYLTYSSAFKRLVMVALAAVILVVANGVRAYIVMAVASATQMQYFGGRDHIYFGWLLFGVVMMLIMWIGARFADNEEPQEPDLADTIDNQASTTTLPVIGAMALVMLAITVKPLQADFGEAGAMFAAVAALFLFVLLIARRAARRDNTKLERAGTVAGRLSWRGMMTAVITILILTMTPRLAATVAREALASIHDISIEAAVPCVRTGPWQGRWQPDFLNFSVERSATVNCSGRQVNIYIAAYATVLQGQELISSANVILPLDWDSMSTSSIHVLRSNTGNDISVAELRADSPGYATVIWYWYEVDGKVATGPILTKAYQLLALLRGQPAGGRVVVIATAANTEMDEVREQLEFVARRIIGSGSYVRVGEAR